MMKTDEKNLKEFDRNTSKKTFDLKSDNERGDYEIWNNEEPEDVYDEVYRS